jgi:DNA-binding response OmpR family regulator
MRVLVVEPAMRFRDMVLETLANDRHVASGVSSGKEALARLAERSDAFDLVITSTDAAGMSGVEFGLRVRKSGNQVPIVFMTGHQLRSEQLPVSNCVEAYKFGGTRNYIAAYERLVA